MSRVTRTTDYDQFKSMLSNRQINKPHLANLTESIRKRNLLEYQPIVVNDLMEVIDGQHRLLAARELEAVIYYIKAPKLTIEDVQLLNTNVNQWSMDDYINSYIVRGNSDYIYLKKFSEKYGLSHSMSAAILSINEDTTFFSAPYKAIKKGTFTVQDRNLSNEFVFFYKSICPYTEENTFRDRDLARALYLVFRDEEIDLVEFVDKIKAYEKPIFRRAGVREYLSQFEDVYNKGRSQKVRLY